MQCSSSRPAKSTLRFSLFLFNSYTSDSFTSRTHHPKKICQCLVNEGRQSGPEQGWAWHRDEGNVRRNLSGHQMSFNLVNLHVLIYLLQRGNCQKVGRNCKPDWVDVNDGESPAFVRRQTCGCSNTDATTRQCVTERKVLYWEKWEETLQGQVAG